MLKKRSAFTMIELVFVIVVMGILAKFGTELFLQTYENYARTMIVNDLDSKSEAAIQQIANRLSYRLRDSVIASNETTGTFRALESALDTDNVIEWINQDVTGWNDGNYSGIIDLNNANTTLTQLASPGTNLLPDNGAIIFMGANINVSTGFGWHGSTATNLHRYDAVTTAGIIPFSGTNVFNAGDDIYEYYQVAESASALVYNSAAKTINLYDGYQPWNIGGANRTYTTVDSNLLVENVKTISVQKVGDVILVVLCLSDNNFMGEGEYSICKTKTVF
jgi:prepilin-type N-terminal cleavage/methylation domain-containing protein